MNLRYVVQGGWHVLRGVGGGKTSETVLMLCDLLCGGGCANDPLMCFGNAWHCMTHGHANLRRRRATLRGEVLCVHVIGTHLPPVEAQGHSYGERFGTHSDQGRPCHVWCAVSCAPPHPYHCRSSPCQANDDGGPGPPNVCVPVCSPPAILIHQAHCPSVDRRIIGAC